MWISKLKIQNFRNYNFSEIDLSSKINIFYGKNAQGKTNIIESIFLGSIGKSFRTNKERELIKLGEKNCDVEIDFEKSDRDGNIKINIGDKKNIFLNGVKIKKLSELLGNINVVIFTPDDINILKGSPEERRKFLNIMISQLRPKYMHLYSLYKKTLDERNSFLKDNENRNYDLLEIYDEKLADYGYEIYKYRNEFVNKIKEKIQIIHSNITEKKEDINIEYVSNCEDKEEFLKLLKQRRQLDFIKGYTTKGIHRDDFKIFVNQLPVDVYGSQGQNRTAVLSLKLSELQVIYDDIGENPILLLDDFMSELDEFRRKSFLENIKDTQVIITSTDKFQVNSEEVKIFQVNNGKVF